MTWQEEFKDLFSTDVAVIIAVPADNAFINPELDICTTLGFEFDQITRGFEDDGGKKE